MFFFGGGGHYRKPLRGSLNVAGRTYEVRNQESYHVSLKPRLRGDGVCAAGLSYWPILEMSLNYKP